MTIDNFYRAAFRRNSAGQTVLVLEFVMTNIGTDTKTLLDENARLEKLLAQSAATIANQGKQLQEHAAAAPGKISYDADDLKQLETLKAKAAEIRARAAANQPPASGAVVNAVVPPAPVPAGQPAAK